MIRFTTIRYVFTAFVLASALFPPAVAQNTTIQSFNKAKKHAAKVYAGHETTFYCSCVYTGKVIDYVHSK